MHCPRCGNVAGAGQQFCRTCGLGLEKIAELIGPELDNPADIETAGLRERQKKLEKWGGIAGLATFSLILLLMIVLVFSQMILRGGFLVIPGTFLILFAIGAGVMGFFQTYAKSLKQQVSRRGLADAKSPLAMTEAALPAPDSITTRTTELLTADQNQSAVTRNL